ncbi:MAG: small multi-drug export protein [Planctomycetota bacterium]
MNEKSLQDLIEQETPRNPRERAWKTVALVTPLFVAILVPTSIGVFLGVEALQRFVANAFIASFFLGKFVIVKGIAGSGYTPMDYALLVIYLDMLVAAFLTFNLDYAYRIPYVGRRLEALQEYGQEVVAERPWVRKVTFLGVILFVMFPLTGTGAVGGSIFGRLLGLTRFRTLTGIFVGSVIGCAGMALLAEGVAALLPDEVRKSVWFEVIGVAFLVLLVLFLWLRSRKVEKLRREGRDTVDQ